MRNAANISQQLRRAVVASETLPKDLQDMDRTFKIRCLSLVSHAATAQREPGMRVSKTTYVRRGVLIAILMAFEGTAAIAAPPTSEIAVSIRYLQAEGISHSQIFLFREDGKLLRQLTHNATGQLKSPVFAPDGAAIVFTHTMPSGEDEYWSVEPNGRNLHRLDAEPAWYAGATTSPSLLSNGPETDPTADDVPQPVAPDGSPILTTPDGAQELILRYGDEVIQNIPGTNVTNDGKDFQLRDVKTGKAVELGNVPGFSGLSSSANFLISPPLRVAFFYVHLNSSDGDTTFALNLTKPRIVDLSPNRAAPVPLPGEPAFLTYTEERYRPIPGSPKTGNCSYIDIWDAALKRVRYGRDTAAVCYGASMVRPGRTPATVTILCGDLGTADGAPVGGF